MKSEECKTWQKRYDLIKDKIYVLYFIFFIYQNDIIYYSSAGPHNSLYKFLQHNMLFDPNS